MTPMKNLRIIYDNAADRATLAASPVAAALAAANLQSDIKTDIYRSTGTRATFVLSWPMAERIGCVAFPFSNLTSGGAMRVRLYAMPDDSAPVLDTGWVFACAPAPFAPRDFGILPLAFNAYRWGGVSTWGNGGGAAAVTWFAPARGRRMVIDLDDARNPQGYIEAGRLVAGDYWSPQCNADFGAGLQNQDSSVHFRNETGDLLTQKGSTSNKLTLQLSHLQSDDRMRLARILRDNGKHTPMLVSLFPENPDPVLEQEYTLYGKASNLAAVTTPYFGTYAFPLEIEGI